MYNLKVWKYIRIQCALTSHLFNVNSTHFEFAWETINVNSIYFVNTYDFLNPIEFTLNPPCEQDIIMSYAYLLLKYL